MLKAQIEPSITYQSRQSGYDWVFSGDPNGQDGDSVGRDENGKGRETDTRVCGFISVFRNKS
jgi:hypothetical protein